MSVSLIKVHDGYNSNLRKEYLIDGSADLANLGQGEEVCSPGSIAYTADMENVWVYGNDGEWHQSTASITLSIVI